MIIFFWTIISLLGIFVFSIIFFVVIPHTVWSVGRFVLLAQPINYIQWWAINPLRFLYKRFDDTNTGPFVRKLARINFRLFFVPRAVLLSIFYIAFTPFRIWSSLYYNILLFYSISLRDNILDWIGFDDSRKLEDYSLKDSFFWLKKFFIEIPNFIGRLFKIAFQGFAMFIVDSIIPALTLYHGTDKSAVDNIVQNGRWQAGSGDYGGLGIYFGTRQDVAEYYGTSSSNPRIIIVRVSIPFIRTLYTIPEKIKIATNTYDRFHYPLRGGQGKLISQFLDGTPWRITELWRNRTNPKNPKQKGWYELCVAQEKIYAPTPIWRIRPIGELKDGKLGRLHKGIHTWPNTIKDWSAFAFSFFLFFVLISLISNLSI